MISLRDPDIDSLTYDRSDTDKVIPLTRGDKNLLCIFQDYIHHCHSIGDPIGQDWLSISTEDFEDYWLGHYLNTFADPEAQPPASTAQNSLQFRPSQFPTVDQAHAQDFVEDLDPGYTDAVETIPSANEGIPRLSPDHVFAISEDHPCIEPLGGEILSNSQDSSTQDLTSHTLQDLMDSLLPHTSQGFVYSCNVVLKSTKFQVPDLNVVTQATSGSQVAIPLLANSATNASDEDAQKSAQPYQVAFFTAPAISVEPPPKHFTELTMHARSG